MTIFKTIHAFVASAVEEAVKNYIVTNCFVDMIVCYTTEVNRELFSIEAMV
jgi:hypothetical protein